MPEKGDPDLNHYTLYVGELNSDDEYECLQDAICLWLGKLGLVISVSSNDLEHASCYDEGELIAERKAQ